MTIALHFFCTGSFESYLDLQVISVAAAYQIIHRVCRALASKRRRRYELCPDKGVAASVANVPGHQHFLPRICCLGIKV